MNIKFRNVLLATQHLLAMFGATTLVPLLTGLDVATTLLAAGVGTLIFHYTTKLKVPVFLGSSFAFIPGLIAVGEKMGTPYVQGGIIVAGLSYLAFAMLVRYIGIETINQYLPTYVIGTMIAIIGLSLIPVAYDMAMNNLPIALVTLATAILISFNRNKFFSQLSIICGIGVGYIVASAFGIVDFSIITAEGMFRTPNLSVPKFNLTAILIIVPVVLATFMEHIGDITANGTVVGKNFVKDPGLDRTLIGDGLATVFAGLVGAPPNTTYGENTGVLAITKNYNPAIIRMTAVFAIVLSFVGVLSGFLASIPVSVLGGISFLLFGMIAKIGIESLIKDKSWENTDKSIVIVVMLVLGLGGFEIMLFSGISLAAIFGILSHIIITHFR